MTHLSILAVIWIAYMLTQEITVTIQVLHKQGKSIRAISRELGISRNTVKKYLFDQKNPGYTHRPSIKSKLGAFKPYLSERIAQAAPDWIPAVVLMDEIVEQGYQGKIRILRNFLANLKPQVVAEPLVRYETPPGKQMQVDFTIIRKKTP